MQTLKHTKIQFDKIVLFLSVAAVGLLMIWGNPITTLACFGVLFYAIYSLGYTNIPPVLLFIIFYHWTQIYTTVIMSNYIGEDIDSSSENSSVAVYLCLIGVLIMILVYKFQINKIAANEFSKIKKAAEELSATNILILYVIFYFISGFLSAIAFSISGLSQIIFSLVQLKWVLFCLFSLVCLINREKYIILILIVFFEVISGLFSYFSSFKDVLIYILLISFSFIKHIRFKQLFTAVIIFSLLVIAGILWQSIKADYRAFLSRGENKQQINVESDQAYEKLMDLSDKTDINTLNATIVIFLSRIAYTYHFQLVLDRIPKIIPYQNGELWWSNLEFIFTPRALNSNKGILDPSAKTNKYAGTSYAGVNGGTSVSLGYFVEGYIDFGKFGMYIPIILISFFLSFFYRYFIITGSPNILLNFAVVYGMFVPFFALESDAIFFTGRLVITIITFLFLKYFLIKWSLPFLRPLKNKSL